MHTRYALPLWAALFPAALAAQPTLTPANNVPAAGSEYNVNVGSWDFPGPAAANTLYGFWNLASTDNRWIYYLAPSVTSTSAQVPGVQLLSTDGGSDTLFWSVTANGLEILADKGGLGLIRYTDAPLEIKYPCSFGTTWTDALSAAYVVQGLNVQRTGTVTGNADGWGTLQLPRQQLNNVLRVKVRKQITDASPFVTISRRSETHYFFVDTVPHPVLRLQLDTAVVGNGAPAVTREALWMYGAGAVGLGELSADDVLFTAYPNPAQGPVDLRFADAAHGARTLEVVDATGRLARSLALPQQSTPNLTGALHTGGLAPGVYLLRLVGERGVLGTQRLVVQ